MKKVYYLAYFDIPENASLKMGKFMRFMPELSTREKGERQQQQQNSILTTIFT